MKIIKIGVGGVKLTKVSESFIAKPYMCPAGVWTQGFGTTRNPDTGKRVHKNDAPIGLEIATKWLEVDYKEVYFPIADRLVPDELVQHEMDACCDFVYNTGGFWMNKNTGSRHPYKLFNLILGYKTGRVDLVDLKKYWEECAITGAGKVLPGLVIRRKREVELFFTGKFI